jgi:hypothetical protein
MVALCASTDIVLGDRWVASLCAAGQQAAPGLVRALERTQATPLDADGTWPALLKTLYGVDVAAGWCPAAQSWHADSATGQFDAGGEGWWRADPVHLVPGMRDLQLVATPTDLGLDADETDTLVASLNRHFESERLQFFAATPERWYLRVPDGIDAVTVPPRAVPGGNVHARMPRGPDARRLAAVMNEIQMLLAEHPCNQQREQRGLATVNGLWIWGGGARHRDPLAGTAASRLPRLAASDPVLRGAWMLAQRSDALLPPPEPASPERWALGPDPTATEPAAPGGVGYLLVLDDEIPLVRGGRAAGEAAACLERCWNGWLARRRRGARLRVIAGRTALTVAGPGRWWRRPVPLAQQLEPVDSAG